MENTAGCDESKGRIAIHTRWQDLEPPWIRPRVEAVQTFSVDRLPLETVLHVVSYLREPRDLHVLMKAFRFSKSSHPRFNDDSQIGPWMVCALERLATVLGLKLSPKTRQKHYAIVLRRLKKRETCFGCGHANKICPGAWGSIPLCLTCFRKHSPKACQLFSTTGLRAYFGVPRSVPSQSLGAFFGDTMHMGSKKTIFRASSDGSAKLMAWLRDRTSCKRKRAGFECQHRRVDPRSEKPAARKRQRCIPANKLSASGEK